MAPKEIIYKELKAAGLVDKELKAYKMSDFKNIVGLNKDKLSEKALSAVLLALEGKMPKEAEGEEMTTDIDPDGQEENNLTNVKCMKKDTLLGSKKPSVRIDATASYEDVVKWDKSGCDLFFEDSSEDVFLRLPEDVVKQLSHYNARRYFISEHNIDGKLITGEEFQPLVFDGPRPGSAADLLKVKEYEKSNLHMYPAKPEEVEARKAMGYKNVGTLVSKNGKVESVEMVIPKDRYQAHIESVAKEHHSRIKRKVKEVEQAARNASRTIGKKIPFKDESDFRD